MADRPRREIRSQGLRVLLSCHPHVRKLKKYCTPFAYGNTLSNSSWLLMDYIGRLGLPKKTHVMDVGCGWGLAGIYCAKRHRAIVTSVDVDPDVFPFLRLQAGINKVKVTTIRRSFGGLNRHHLRNIDAMIGADICFWESMIDPLKKLIWRALGEGVKMVIIADPGRWTFEKLGEHIVNNKMGDVLDWEVQRPKRLKGRILKVGSL